MRSVIFFFSVLSFSFAAAQSAGTAFDSARSVIRRDVKAALPYFQEVFAKGDSATKRRAIDFLTARWVSINGNIALSGVASDYAKMASDYVNSNFQGKESAMTAADQYTAGMVFYALAYSGMNTRFRSAITYLHKADQNGDTRAILPLANAVKFYRNIDKSIGWGDVVDLFTRASQVAKSHEPLLSLGQSAYVEYKRQKDKSAPEADTLMRVFFSALGNQAAVVPDSFHLAIDAIWRSAFAFREQDTIITNMITGYLQNGNAPPATSPAKKGVAWHYLYLFFYDMSRKNDSARYYIMNSLKSYYNNDRLLLNDIAEFVNTAQPGNAGYVLGVKANWLDYFMPVEVIDPKSFFRAAAASGQDIAPFYEKNKKDIVAEAIGYGYQDRFNIFTDIMSDQELVAAARFNVVQYAASLNLQSIQKLKAIPELKSNRQIKFALADISVAQNMAAFFQGGNIPMEFDRLPAVFEDWTTSDKIIYNRKYLDFLLKEIQATIDARKGAMSLAQAAGKPALDFNDYNKAQDILNKVKTMLKAG